MTNILDRFRLDGSVALVTGASFGLGRTMALGLAEAGADVVGISRTLENLAESGADVEALGRRFLPIACDVGDRAALRTAIDAAHGWQSRLDILVNNAGIIERAPAEVHPDDAWDRVMRTNLDAVWIASQAAGHHPSPPVRCSPQLEKCRAAGRAARPRPGDWHLNGSSTD